MSVQMMVARSRDASQPARRGVPQQAQETYGLTGASELPGAPAESASEHHRATRKKFQRARTRATIAAEAGPTTKARVAFKKYPQWGTGGAPGDRESHTLTRAHTRAAVLCARWPNPCGAQGQVRGRPALVAPTLI